jgi:hypothetical protein
MVLNPAGLLLNSLSIPIMAPTIKAKDTCAASSKYIDRSININLGNLY